MKLTAILSWLSYVLIVIIGLHVLHWKFYHLMVFALAITGAIHYICNYGVTAWRSKVSSWSHQLRTLAFWILTICVIIPLLLTGYTLISWPERFVGDHMPYLWVSLQIGAITHMVRFGLLLFFPLRFRLQ